jgi:hypothetical protein
MPDLQALLDQIQRLDQEAEAGPWRLNEVMGGDYLVRGDADVAEAWGLSNSEFIALARTALPQLAKALQAVLTKCASMERGVGYRVSGQHDTWDSYHEGMSDMAGYIEEAISDAMEDQ